MLSKSLIQFSVYGAGCGSSLLFDLKPNYGGSYEHTSFKGSCAFIASFSAPNTAAGHHRPTSPLETPGHSQASLGPCLVGSLLSPGSWCTQGFVCALQETVSPVLWKLCKQIPLASKVKFPGDFQSLCRIPSLENLLWVLELLQQCKNIFDIIVLQFVGHLLGGSLVRVMLTSSRRIYVTRNAS